MAELEVAGSDLDLLYADGRVDVPEARELPTHTGLVLLSERGSGLGSGRPDKSVRPGARRPRRVRRPRRSAEQRVALDLLLDPDVGIVSLGGRAGTGKSALALCAGLESVLERRAHKKVVVFRPLYAVGGQELGYLPGDSAEKMGPGRRPSSTPSAPSWPRGRRGGAGPRAARGAAAHAHPGRSLHDAFVVVDEAQSLERGVLLTVLSRLGQGSRVVLTHDVAQRDNLRVGRHDGVAAVIEALKGHPLFAHVTLTRSERSPIAALVTEMLEDLPL
jgi:PhoH-like ATPase